MNRANIIAMDVNSSLFIQQQAASQLQTNQNMLKRSARQEQQVANLLSDAVEAAATPGKTRGVNLDISV